MPSPATPPRSASPLPSRLSTSTRSSTALRCPQWAISPATSLLRSLFYQRLGLSEPDSAIAEPLTVDGLHTGIGILAFTVTADIAPDSTVRLRRRRIDVRPIPAGPSHLVVHADHPIREHRTNADILFTERTDNLPALFAQAPGSRMVVSTTTSTTAIRGHERPVRLPRSPRARPTHDRVPADTWPCCPSRPSARSGAAPARSRPDRPRTRRARAAPGHAATATARTPEGRRRSRAAWTITRSIVSTWMTAPEMLPDAWFATPGDYR